ncbi:MAG: nucleotidyltransferase [Chloroflexi bacterium]|nr:nucleotidyltransferase [Chloroflexota bacterium]
MRRDEILSILSLHRKELRKFGVTSIGVIGSAARDELEPYEDLELIVDFDPDEHVGLSGFVRLERHLCQLFDRTVVLGMPDALKKWNRQSWLEDAVYAE